MDENGEAVEVRQRSESFPIALMALPLKPQSTWTLEPEHAQNILGGQVRAWQPLPIASHVWGYTGQLRNGPVNVIVLIMHARA